MSFPAKKHGFVPKIATPFDSVVVKDENGNLTANIITASLNGSAKNFGGQLVGDIVGGQTSTKVMQLGGVPADKIAECAMWVEDATANGSTLVSKDTDNRIIGKLTTNVESIRESANLASTAATMALQHSTNASQFADVAKQSELQCQTAVTDTENAHMTVVDNLEATQIIQNMASDYLQRTQELNELVLAIDSHVQKAHTSAQVAQQSAIDATQSSTAIVQKVINLQSAIDEVSAVSIDTIQTAAVNAEANKDLCNDYKQEVVVLINDVENVVERSSKAAGKVDEETGTVIDDDDALITSALESESSAKKSMEDALNAYNMTVSNVNILRTEGYTLPDSSTVLTGDVGGTLGASVVDHIHNSDKTKVYSKNEIEQFVAAVNTLKSYARYESTNLTATTFNGSLQGNADYVSSSNNIEITQQVTAIFSKANDILYNPYGRIGMTLFSVSPYAFQYGASCQTVFGSSSALKEGSGGNSVIGSVLLNNVTGSGGCVVIGSHIQSLEGYTNYTSQNFYNAIVGTGALGQTKSAISSTCCGYKINSWSSQPDYAVTVVGANSGTAKKESGFYQNCIAIGSSPDDQTFTYEAIRIDADNKIILGNRNVTAIEGPEYKVASDARCKTLIAENVPGMSFITKLRPVTYLMDHARMAQSLGKKLTTNIAELPVTRKTGFVAQEVEAAAVHANYDFDAVIPPTTESGYYTVAYAQFVAPLVKAFQDQLVINAAQEEELLELMNRLTILESL